MHWIAASDSISIPHIACKRDDIVVHITHHANRICITPGCYWPRSTQRRKRTIHATPIPMHIYISPRMIMTILPYNALIAFSIGNSPTSDPPQAWSTHVLSLHRSYCPHPSTHSLVSSSSRSEQGPSNFALEHARFFLCSVASFPINRRMNSLPHVF